MSLAPIHRYIGRIIHLMRKEKGMRQSELALLTGLKQPNLSRIENGLVSPRQVTLEKIAKALGVDVQVFYSESKVQEVERKWAASMGPKHAALMLAGRMSPVALLDTASGYPVQSGPTPDEPMGQLEAMLQLPPIKSADESSHQFALTLRDDSMYNADGGNSFRAGEVVVFSSALEVKPGDFAFVITGNTSVFRRVNFSDPENLALAALNPAYPEIKIPRAEARMWRLVQHLRKY